MLIQLGNFQFSISTVAYNEIERISTYSFASHQVIGSYDRLQALGPNNETIRLTGSYFSDLKTIIGGSSQDPFETLRNMGDTLQPQQLQSGDGKNHGYFVIVDLNVKGGHYVEQGSLKSDFTLQLKYYGRRLE